MFKVGELVTTLGGEVGIVLETKSRLHVQYCKVLVAGGPEPRWFQYTFLKEAT